MSNLARQIMDRILSRPGNKYTPYQAKWIAEAAAEAALAVWGGERDVRYSIKF